MNKMVKAEAFALDATVQDFADKAAARIRGLQGKLVSDVAEIGKALSEVKERVGHGNFGPWLKGEFDWTERTAQNFMNVAERFGSNPKPVSHLPLSMVYQLAAPSTPEPVREKIVAKLEAGEVERDEIAAEIADVRREAKAAREQEKKLAGKSPEARKKAQAAFDRRLKAAERERERIRRLRAEEEDRRAEAAKMIVGALGPEGTSKLMRLLEPGDDGGWTIHIGPAMLKEVMQ